eukprot:Nitzschia sp. Nitz4//scaffold54_size114964//82109//83860//NITZ4_003860-RA/size114964-processed-gene-0.166-mRNA-1//1//CDS//3329554378//8894//frame0
MGPAQKSSLPLPQDASVPCHVLEDAPWGDSEQVVQVKTTATATFFLTSSGQVYTCGTLHGNIRPQLTKTVIQLPLKVVEIAAGRHFGLALMEGGLAVCSWGAGHFGQLALGGDSPPYVDQPTVIPSLLPHVVGSPVTTIAAGYWHAMAVTKAGTVFAWGCNRSAQCGFKPTKDPPTLCDPRSVQFERLEQPKIVKVAAGRSHSVALDDKGKIYSWGACQHGQCGVLVRRRGAMVTPRQIESLSQVNIVDIAAGDSHTMALTSGGRVFGFGGGSEGQLGTGSVVSMNHKPKLVGDLDFVAIAAGREWMSQQKQLNGGGPPPAPTERVSPKLSQVPRIVALDATGNCSMALDSMGHLYVWGCNDIGNLGVPKPHISSLPFLEPDPLKPRPTSSRDCHTQSFDSSHNIAIPQRVQGLSHLRIQSFAASPSFMWCAGTRRTTHDSDPVLTGGQTLYEIQESKASYVTKPTTTKLAAKPAPKEPIVSPKKMPSSQMDPPEMKDGTPVSAPPEGVFSSNKKKSSPEEGSTASQETDPKSPTTPSGQTKVKNKRRFSLPKALGKMVGRGSFQKSNSAVGDDDDSKKRAAG